MAEPISTSFATAATTAVTVVSLCPGIDASTVIGAFAGAVVFVMASTHLSIIKRVAFFMVSIINGCLCAKTVAAELTSMLPTHVDVPPSVGALIGAAVSVKLLLWLISRADHLDTWLDRFKRDKS